MIKRIIVFGAALALVICSFTSCKKEPPATSSKIPASSNLTSSQITSSETESNISEPEVTEEDMSVIRNSFLSVDENGDLFYCAASGGIYKQLADGRGISKIYSSNGYDFFSVDAFDNTKICVGYKSSQLNSSYIIFDLKDKTVVNAVSDADFKSQNIYSLMHYKDAVYFLSTPDRYNRYTLYMQKEEEIRELAKGVNEFFIQNGRIIYNLGNSIFSLNPDEGEPELICMVETNDLLGFTVVGDRIFYSTQTDTYYTKISSGGYTKIPQQLNVWTSTANDTHTFFCGAEGGIYALSYDSGEISKVSDYTASQIICNGNYLYLSPAESEDYPEVDKSLIIQGGIYRFAISDLLKQNPEGSDSSGTSSSLSSSETGSALTSSSPAQTEVAPPAPEYFGR